MPQQWLTRENAFGLRYHDLKKFMGNFAYNFVQQHEQDHEVSLLIYSAIELLDFCGQKQ